MACQIRRLQHSSAMTNILKTLQQYGKSQKSVHHGVSCRYYSRSASKRNKVLKPKLKTLENTNSDVKATTSVYAEMFAGSSDIKTDSELHQSTQELEQLEAMLNRRLSMNFKNTVLETGDVYIPAGENSSNDEDQREYGEAQEFLEEIKATRNDLVSDEKETKPVKRDAYIYGTADPDIPMSNTPCAGCGAILHCQDPGIPGYVPSQIFLETKDTELKRTICKRCYVLQKHQVAMDVSVSPEEYVKVLEGIKPKRGLILLVLDVLDLPNSIFKDLPLIVGKYRPFYVVGNKIDLLPRDSKGYLERTKLMIKSYLDECGLSGHNTVRHLSLISAKTGYGVEDLVSKLFSDWGRQGDVYVMGCANVGKSTLYNALLYSDYCRNLSRDFIYRATVSNWPGTTLNTLKFPVLNPTPSKLAQRTKRLNTERDIEVQEKMLRQKKLSEKKRISIHDATLKGKVGQSFAGAREAAADEVKQDDRVVIGPSYTGSVEDEDIKETTSDPVSAMQTRIKHIMAKYDAESMDASRYCYDTPGVVNRDQIINLLNERELTVMLAKRLIIPKTFVIHPGQTMFISGLGRIDYLEGFRSVFFTVVCSSSLPVHVMKTAEAEDFYREHVGTKTLVVPVGGEERLRELPPLAGKQFSVKCVGWYQSASDVILSSLGWVGVTGTLDMEVTLKAFTPEGRGIHLRSPSLLENAVNMKGKRIRGTSGYHPRIHKDWQ